MKKLKRNKTTANTLNLKTNVKAGGILPFG